MFEEERLKKLDLIKEKCNVDKNSKKIGKELNKKLYDEDYLKSLMERTVYCLQQGDKFRNLNAQNNSDFLVPLLHDYVSLSYFSTLNPYIDLFDSKYGKKIVSSVMKKRNRIKTDKSNDVYFFTKKLVLLSNGIKCWRNKIETLPDEIDAIYCYRSLDDNHQCSIAGKNANEEFIKNHKTLILTGHDGVDMKNFKRYQEFYYKLLITHNFSTDEAYSYLSDFVNQENDTFRFVRKRK